MKEILSHLSLGQPLYLPLLLLLPLLWLRLSGRSLAVILWRTMVFLLLVLALTDLERIGEIGRAGERIFAFDLSRSIPAEMRRWMAQQGLTPRAGDRVFVFGGAPREVSDWDQWLRGDLSAAPIMPERTNLEALFSAVLSLPPASRSLFLLTDGWETQGSVERLLPSLALSGLRIFPLLPPDRPAAANVAVKKVIAPHAGASGEGISVKVVVENQNSKAAEGELTLKLNGQPLKRETVTIGPGTRLFTYRGALPEGPMAAIEAEFSPRDPATDRYSQDNQATAWVAVSAKARVLLLNGRGGEGRYLEELLKRRGFEVTSVGPGSVPPAPKGYQTVIFNNVARERFSAAYLAEVERHVAQGNSFLMLGAEGSFAPGGYRQTPIESLLPVELKEPKREEKNRAVILVIDKSGSMREENRLLYAKEAAKAVATQLKDGDLLGVIAFDVEPFVLVPLGAVERIRGSISAQVDRLKAQGKTYLLPALEQAMRQLERQNAGRKHVIILSDGMTPGAQSEYTDLVTFMRDKLKITTSTVAIGEEVDVPLLKRIAQYGGGFFHHTHDPSTLPQIVLQQVQEKPEEGAMVERDFTPQPVKGSELLSGFAEKSYPIVKGYIETEIKRGARLDLVVSREGRSAPLLASWNYGKGKAAAFTTDLHGRWSQAWIRWAGLERFWGQVFRWLEPPREALPPHEVRINATDEQVVLDLYLYAEGHDAALFRYSIRGKQADGEGTLDKLAPGHYQTALPIAAPGDYRIALVEEVGRQRLSYPTVGYTLSQEPKREVVRDSFNISLLEKLARSTGGRINPPGDQALKPLTELSRTSQPLRPYLLAAAFALLLAEIIFRGFFLPAER